MARNNQDEDAMLSCDYLVVGAGQAGLAFVDTLLMQAPHVKVIIVDKHEAPGGHWNDAYDHVRLHQPSVLYGVESKQLEGNWLWCLLAKRTLPWQHRATKKEILEYFGDLVNKWVAKGQVRYFPKHVFDFDLFDATEQREAGFVSLDGKDKMYGVAVAERVVNGAIMEPLVPSLTPVPFPVDPGIDLITPNELFERKVKGHHHYVVIGCGKTGMDAVTHLQREKGVDPKNVTLIMPNDCWIFNRNSLKKRNSTPLDFPSAVLDCDGDMGKALRSMEDQGKLVRVDPSVTPTRFRYAMIGQKELLLLRQVRKVREGRVAGIKKCGGKNVLLEFEKEGCNIPFDKDVTFVHCCSPGPFNGHPMSYESDNWPIFSDKMITLAIIATPPISFSVSCIAYLEASRLLGKLDLEFGRKLLGGDSGVTPELEPDLVLKKFVKHFSPLNESPRAQTSPMKLLAMFFALADSNCMKVMEWAKQNRLAFFSLPLDPALKVKFLLDLEKMVKKREVIGLSEKDVNEIELLIEKLKPIMIKVS
eukprot:CAMPEP_0182606470 /NCGR_PEP_ID=MMETSP1330-20130603/1324_1 /TAXON_ID=464278 /ORGANISM="Picochlorum sp., Strain RCC944" /LENGTH=530 /DNA_ID=CAMNT_0024824805 /DNA_START=213 /DNA_END=1805 /DNA_ORIENTATION=+